MDAIYDKLLAAALGGGPQAVIAILMLIIVVLVLDRKRLVKEIEKKDEKLEKIVDDYYKGNLTLTEALNSMKLLLYELKGGLN